MNNLFDDLTSGGDASDANGGKNQSEPPMTAGDSSTESDNSMSRTPVEVRGAVQELLRDGYVDQTRKPDVFKRIVVHERAVGEVLDSLDLAMRLDSHRGIAVVTVRKEDAETSDAVDPWTHPLVRRQRLQLDQSLLVAILRQMFVLHEQEHGVGGPPAVVAVDDLLPEFRVYMGDSGSDRRDEQKLRTLLDQLSGYGVVSKADASDQCTIRPLIAHLADPASLVGLLEQMKSLAENAAKQADAPE